MNNSNQYSIIEESKTDQIQSRTEFNNSTNQESKRKKNFKRPQIEKLDLHRLSSKDAKKITNDKLNEIAATGGIGYNMCQYRGQNYVRYKIITGRGKHSVNGEKVLYYVVRKLLLKRKWYFEDDDMGGSLVVWIPV